MLIEEFGIKQINLTQKRIQPILKNLVSFDPFYVTFRVNIQRGFPLVRIKRAIFL